MNTYLLDTHILLWWLSDNNKLSEKVAGVIADPDNRILVSAASIWELSIKQALKKIEIPNNLIDILLRNDIEFLAITVEHALCVAHLPFIHNDPFDRLLIAQSLVEDYILVTADKFIVQYDINYLAH